MMSLFFLMIVALLVLGVIALAAFGIGAASRRPKRRPTGCTCPEQCRPEVADAEATLQRAQLSTAAAVSTGPAVMDYVQALPIFARHGSHCAACGDKARWIQASLR
jgi:hypothetical protein